jgi:hypothetical protein
MKLINYRELSRVLTGDIKAIRSNQVPKKYNEAINELKAFIEFWLKKWGRNENR